MEPGGSPPPGEELRGGCWTPSPLHSGLVLPQRNPLVLAKQLASLDAVSGGRLVFGMGVGYLEPELRSLA
jgi:hypothetical protein